MVSKVMSNLIKRFFGEVLGTFIFILVALGSVAQVVVAGGKLINNKDLFNTISAAMMIFKTH